MSHQQRESLAYWSNIFFKIMIGFSGGILLLLYNSINDTMMENKSDFKDALEKVEKKLEQHSTEHQDIKRRVDLLEYKIDR